MNKTEIIQKTGAFLMTGALHMLPLVDDGSRSDFVVEQIRDLATTVLNILLFFLNY